MAELPILRPCDHLRNRDYLRNSVKRKKEFAHVDEEKY
jgi:hypothetical protein